MGKGGTRDWRRLLITLGVVLALAQLFRAFHGAQTRFIANDGDWYYAHLASLYFDHDLDLSNQMATWQKTVGGPPLAVATGRPTPTAFTVGPAVLWLPAFALADAVVWVADKVRPLIPRNGCSMPYQLAVAWATLLYGLIGVWFSFQAALWWCGSGMRRWRDGPALAIAALLLASPALYYLFFEPTMAHGLSIFTASLLVWLWLRTGHSGRWWRWALVGLAGGLCAWIWPQDGILLLLPASTILLFRSSGLLVRASALVAGAAIAFLPQALVWQATFGRPVALPQGPDFLVWIRPALLQVWFSPHHGLFTWTPIWLAGLVGLRFVPPERRRDSVALLLVFLLESYVNAAARDWWAGDAFGARRFLGLFPVFALGLSSLACCLSRRSYAYAAAGITIAANLALMVAYVTGRIPHG